MSDGLSMALQAAADVLAEVSAELEQLGARLCADPAIVQRHMEQLQAIDLIAQKQRSLASVLRAECAANAIDAIGVEELRSRLSPNLSNRQPTAAKN